jgi:hypothetical protein
VAAIRDAEALKNFDWDDEEVQSQMFRLYQQAIMQHVTVTGGQDSLL